MFLKQAKQGQLFRDGHKSISLIIKTSKTETIIYCCYVGEKDEVWKNGKFYIYKGEHNQRVRGLNGEVICE